MADLYEALKSANYFSQMLANGKTVETDDQRLRVSGLYEDWAPGAYQAGDNAVGIDILTEFCFQRMGIKDAGEKRFQHLLVLIHVFHGRALCNDLSDIGIYFTVASQENTIARIDANFILQSLNDKFLFWNKQTPRSQTPSQVKGVPQFILVFVGQADHSLLAVDLQMRDLFISQGILMENIMGVKITYHIGYAIQEVFLAADYFHQAF